MKTTKKLNESIYDSESADDIPRTMLREGIKKLNDKKHKDWTTNEAIIIIAVISSCFVSLWLVDYFGI